VQQGWSKVPEQTAGTESAAAVRGVVLRALPNMSTDMRDAYYLVISGSGLIRWAATREKEAA
jgi:hypothetical protein